MAFLCLYEIANFIVHDPCQRDTSFSLLKRIFGMEKTGVKHPRLI